MTYNFQDPSLTDVFFKPVFDIFCSSESQRSCPDLSDLEFITMGTKRCTSSSKSGNGFLEDYRKSDGSKLRVSNFFESLKSKRRLSNLISVNLKIGELMQTQLNDELLRIPELNNWCLMAGDGHYQKAAIFDKKTKADTSERKPSKSPVGHVFQLDMRTHHMSYLELIQPEEGRKSEHEIKVLKRIEMDKLRAHAPTGTKVLWLWDKACIDYEFWLKAKHQKGVYFATLEKKNSVTKLIREHTIIDYSDKCNEGVSSDRLVETSAGYEIRQIIYVNPQDGVEYRYLTNELTLPAWCIVLLYKHRWDIEKVFDEFKSKLEEKRSWASSKTAKVAHANFLCLTHNLMILLENELNITEDMRDAVEPRKQEIRMRTKIKKGRKKNQISYINSFFQRASQRTVRFIRWLRRGIYKSLMYKDSLADLADIWRCGTP